jgi:hypothetical protein
MNRTGDDFPESIVMYTNHSAYAFQGDSKQDLIADDSRSSLIEITLEYLLSSLQLPVSQC